MEIDLHRASRAELVDYLESWGFACYDWETTDELRVAALLNDQAEGQQDPFEGTNP